MLGLQRTESTASALVSVLVAVYPSRALQKSPTQNLQQAPKNPPKKQNPNLQEKPIPLTQSTRNMWLKKISFWEYPLYSSQTPRRKLHHLLQGLHKADQGTDLLNPSPAWQKQTAALRFSPSVVRVRANLPSLTWPKLLALHFPDQGSISRVSGDLIFYPP